jgi:5-methylcytosine-specific restriction endonuclease McrA
MNYKQVYFKYYGYGEQDFIACELCGLRASDLHHIKYKSRGGKNNIENLIALCRNCHTLAHSEKIKESELIELHLNNLLM